MKRASLRPDCMPLWVHETLQPMQVTVYRTWLTNSLEEDLPNRSRDCLSSSSCSRYNTCQRPHSCAEKVITWWNHSSLAAETIMTLSSYNCDVSLPKLRTIVYVYVLFSGCNVNAVNNKNKLPLYLAIESRAHNQVRYPYFFIIKQLYEQN